MHGTVLQIIAKSTERSSWSTDVEEMLQFACCSVVSQPCGHCLI